MKKFLSVTILFFSLMSACFSQVNLNQQAVIRPNDGNFFTVLQNGLAKRVNQKELQDTFSKNILKGSLIGYWEDVLSVSDSVNFNSIRPFTRFGANIPNGWYVYSVTTESNGINTITRKLYNVGVNIDDNIIETVTLKNGWQLLVQFQNNVAVAHYVNYGGFTTIDYMIDLLSQRITAEQAARIAADNAINATVATKAPQTSLNNTNTQVQKGIDSLAIHRTELNAKSDSITQLRLALNLKADSLTTWKIGGNNNSTSTLLFGKKIGLVPIAGSISSNYKLRFALNIDSLIANTSNYSVLDVTGNYLAHTRSYYHPQNIQAKSTIFSQLGVNHAYIFSSIQNTSVAIDYNTTGYLYRSTYSVYNPSDTINMGHKSGIEFTNYKFGSTLDSNFRTSKLLFIKKGVAPVTSDSGSVGSLFMVYAGNNLTGSLFVQRYRDNIGVGQIGTGRREVAYQEDVQVKSANQTLQAGTNPTFDFENRIQKTLAITTVQAGDFLTPTLLNLKDGGRYSIKFAAPFSTFLNFPSNVFKRDGTAFGTYTVMAEILDFVAIGSNLYCVNK